MEDDAKGQGDEEKMKEKEELADVDKREVDDERGKGMVEENEEEFSEEKKEWDDGKNKEDCMLVGSKKLVVSNDGGFNDEMDGDVVGSDSRLEEAEDDVLEQGDEGLETGSIVGMEILKEQRIELCADMRQEEVDEDENKQGDEGKMVKMLRMEMEIGEMEQELVSFKSDNDLYVVEEKEDKVLKIKKSRADSKKIGDIEILEME